MVDGVAHLRGRGSAGGSGTAEAAAPPSHPAGVPVGLHVIRIDPHGDPRWTSFVAEHPQARIYHHPGWLRALGREYAETPAHLACEDARGRLRGVLPLLGSSGLFTGRRLLSLPRTPAAGPLALDTEATTALLRAAIALAHSEHRLQLRLKIPSPELDGLVEGLVGFPYDSTYVLELPERAEDLHFGTSRNHARGIRKAVNKAARLGVSVRAAGSEAELRAWYPLYLDTMRSLAAPPRALRFFETLWRELWPAGHLRLLLAERSARGRRTLLAGSVLLMLGDTTFAAFSGSRREALPLRPNDAIYSQALREASEQGFRRFDFGEVPLGNEGLARYKAKWMDESGHLYRYYYPAPPQAEVGAWAASGRAGDLGRAAWRRLPLRTTAVLGDRLYRWF